MFCHYVSHLLFHLLLAKTKYVFDNTVQLSQLNNVYCPIKLLHMIQLYIVYIRFILFSLYIVVYLRTHITNQGILHTLNILYDLVVHHNIYVTFTHIMFALQCFVVVRIIHVMSILYSNSIINHNCS